MRWESQSPFLHWSIKERETLQQFFWNPEFGSSWIVRGSIIAARIRRENRLTLVGAVPEPECSSFALRTSRGNSEDDCLRQPVEDKNRQGAVLLPVKHWTRLGRCCKTLRRPTFQCDDFFLQAREDHCARILLSSLPGSFQFRDLFADCTPGHFDASVRFLWRCFCFLRLLDYEPVAATEYPGRVLYSSRHEIELKLPSSRLRHRSFRFLESHGRSFPYRSTALDFLRVFQ